MGWSQQKNLSGKINWPKKSPPLFSSFFHVMLLCILWRGRLLYGHVTGYVIITATLTHTHFILRGRLSYFHFSSTTTTSSSPLPAIRFNNHWIELVGALTCMDQVKCVSRCHLWKFEGRRSSVTVTQILCECPWCGAWKGITRIHVMSNDGGVVALCVKFYLF